MSELRLTDRALADLDEIARRSVREWSSRVAGEYLDDLNAALGRLEENPGLLRGHSDYSGRLQFYGVREHVLVCDVFDGRIFILTVWHGAMDIVGRLEKLEPQLVQEAELMARKLEKPL
ncbi:type II toxin-antitoxin system RelE/ParE family toxin [Engelhardtia mirabilis]|uniref:Plasmid stabilization system protein n=1 Tax=Engelhardtia mirabilis TaxID=2528011 RepID=A0A518BT65_9BACT|nr:Plasmid stabilization system protein [Planctomycetes bacterium Pla133]QDV04473.1 Plasmid stabilization system protein [Planctomycetes bacterium Pla86]